MERRHIAIHGIVQGVGFRPFVHRLASRLHLGGSVTNNHGAVMIEVEGDESSLDAFLGHLTMSPPPLARIARVDWQRHPVRGESRFRIDPSESTCGGGVFIAPDLASCDACLAEMWNPNDRRYRYPFLNCTHCGPRLTIIRQAPYDRERTTMASFAMCGACRQEYDDQDNRRFHAQATACPVCGPHLELLDAAGQRIATDDPLTQFAAELLRGRIGALKGLGGYHFVCDATRESTVRELRHRKRRDEKSFAVMLADIHAVEAFCEVSELERELLLAPSRPIVLLKALHRSPMISDAVAPGNPFLGVMLPYTPLHHLLMKAAAGLPLVMTSGNRSNEPIACNDADAVHRLAGIADVFLVHNRPIHVRCDDSVTRIVAGAELPVRRSRGHAPQPVPLPFDLSAPVLAVGGQFKGTFALGRDRYAFLSHHMGDLDHFEAYRAFERDVALYEKLFKIAPEAIAHDLHPDYASTHYAHRRSESDKASSLLLPVQHHHAHLASCMAENGLTEPVIGVIFDGTGYGLDGAIWGGEFLVGDYHQVRRRAHFRYVGMPGGDQAIREPWRMAAAHLVDAEVELSAFEHGVGRSELKIVRQMLHKRFNAPSTSSAGRLFDAVAALAGVRNRVSFEGQAAMELEWLAMRVQEDGSYPFEVQAATEPESVLIIDTRPLVRAVAEDVIRDVKAATIGRRFHTTMVEIIAAVCARLRHDSGLDRVALSGGVFMNALLVEETLARLRGDGFTVYRHRLVPPNDGGLSLGQLAVAGAVLSRTANWRAARSEVPTLP